MSNLNEKLICKRKKRFSNEASARDALKKINPKGGLKKPRRVYKCNVCGGYHLSSKSS